MNPIDPDPLIAKTVSLFRKRTEEEQRYFEVEPSQRWTMAAMYFGLIAILALGMPVNHSYQEARSGY